MAAANTVAAQNRLLLLPCPRPRPRSKTPSLRTFFRTGLRRTATAVAAQDLDVLPVQSADSIDQPTGVSSVQDREVDGLGSGSQVGGFAYESGGIGVGGGGGFSPSPPPDGIEGEEDVGMMVDRAINATIVLAAGTFAITKLLTIDSDYWHGWTIFEILRYAPLHNWYAYEEALKANPVLAKMMISGVVYSVGDWIAQCYEGKPLFDFDRARMFRSGLVGFTLHGSLSHYYYRFCEVLFPFHNWWVVPAKVVFDQTVWSAIWNSIYFVTLGILRLESPANIYSELKATFRPMLTESLKLSMENGLTCGMQN